MVQSYKLRKMFYIPLTPVYLLIKSLPAHISEFYQSYELDLRKTTKSKSMALKSVDDVDSGGFDDELSATKIAYLAKNCA